MWEHALITSGFFGYEYHASNVFMGYRIIGYQVSRYLSKWRNKTREDGTLQN